VGKRAPSRIDSLGAPLRERGKDGRTYRPDGGAGRGRPGLQRSPEPGRGQATPQLPGPRDLPAAGGAVGAVPFNRVSKLTDGFARFGVVLLAYLLGAGRAPEPPLRAGVGLCAQGRKS